MVFILSIVNYNILLVLIHSLLLIGYSLFPIAYTGQPGLKGHVFADFVSSSEDQASLASQPPNRECMHRKAVSK